jgi:hypothetical protein
MTDIQVCMSSALISFPEFDIFPVSWTADPDQIARDAFGVKGGRHNVLLSWGLEYKTLKPQRS